MKKNRHLITLLIAFVGTSIPLTAMKRKRELPRIYPQNEYPTDFFVLQDKEPPRKKRKIKKIVPPSFQCPAPNPGQNPPEVEKMVRAIEKQNKNIFDDLINKLSPHTIANFFMRAIDRHCSASLMAIAIYSGWKYAINQLTKRGASPQQRDANGNSLMFYAALGGSWYVMEHLHRYAGLSYQEKSSNGTTLAHIAAKADQQNVLRLLNKQGIGYDVKNGAGETPLHFAAAGSKVYMIHFLCKQLGVKTAKDLLEVRDNNGNTIMHAAAQAGKLRIMASFKKWGIPYSVTNNAGHTPLDVVAV